MSFSVKKTLITIGTVIATSGVTLAIGIDLSGNSSKPNVVKPEVVELNVVKPGIVEPKPKPDMERFKSIFEYWGNELQYDRAAGDKIHNAVNKDVWRLATSDLPPDSLRILGIVDGDPDMMARQIYEGARLGKKIQKIYIEKRYELVIKYLRESKKGVCRHFAYLLEEEGRKIGMDIYQMRSKNHASNLYKLDGKWYVADLTVQVCSKHKNDHWYYKMSLDDYLKKYMKVTSAEDRKNITVLNKGFDQIPLDEFLSKH